MSISVTVRFHQQTLYSITYAHAQLARSGKNIAENRTVRIVSLFGDRCSSHAYTYLQTSNFGVMRYSRFISSYTGFIGLTITGRFIAPIVRGALDCVRRLAVTLTPPLFVVGFNRRVRTRTCPVAELRQK